MKAISTAIRKIIKEKFNFVSPLFDRNIKLKIIPMELKKIEFQIQMIQKKSRAKLQYRLKLQCRLEYWYLSY